MLSSCGWLAGDFLLCLMFPLQCCDSVLMCAFFLLFCPLPPPPPPPPLATPLPRCRPCRLVPCNLYQRDQRLKKTMVPPQSSPQVFSTTNRPWRTCSCSSRPSSRQGLCCA
ncbi:hypothetical protein lerEdw1_007641 [Lerista edwardsae]|nr:hypothetical protein lerEdw1_007641 [Lerista edwardsae]